MNGIKYSHSSLLYYGRESFIFSYIVPHCAYEGLTNGTVLVSVTISKR